MSLMNKFKLFVENFIIYGIGGIVSKIVPFVMIPIITWIMPETEYFGISDMTGTLRSFASAIALMGMYDALFRLFFEKDNDEYKKRICSTALVFNMLTSICVFIMMVLASKSLARLFFHNIKYSYMVYIAAMGVLVGATNAIISAPTRMMNKRKVFLITNAISPILAYSIAIPMLMKGYYVVAMPIAAVISGLVMEISFWVLNREWFCLSKFDVKLLKQLLVLAVPLLPNFIIYWIFDSCDRIMITNLLGIGFEGVYAVGAKLGLASQLINTAFAGGWQFFVFSTMREKDQREYNSKIYELLGVVSFIATALVCVISYKLLDILFPEKYLEAYTVAPYLFLAPLLLILYQTGHSQFLVIKKTWPGVFILSSGAIVNIILNNVLITRIGIEGAAIATLLGYVVTCLVDLAVLTKCRLMKVSYRFLIVAVLMFVYFIGWRYGFHHRIIIGLIAWAVYTIISLFIYREDFLKIIRHIRRMSKNIVGGEN